MPHSHQALQTNLREFLDLQDTLTQGVFHIQMGGLTNGPMPSAIVWGTKTGGNLRKTTFWGTDWGGGDWGSNEKATIWVEWGVYICIGVATVGWSVPSISCPGPFLTTDRGQARMAAGWTSYPSPPPLPDVLPKYVNHKNHIQSRNSWTSRKSQIHGVCGLRLVKKSCGCVHSSGGLDPIPHRAAIGHKRGSVPV